MFTTGSLNENYSNLSVESDLGAHLNFKSNDRLIYPNPGPKMFMGKLVVIVAEVFHNAAALGERLWQTHEEIWIDDP